MTRADDANSCFDRGFNCAQAVLSSCCEQYGMSKEEAFKEQGFHSTRCTKYVRDAAGIASDILDRQG
jgi:hypothetical protein